MFNLIKNELHKIMHDKIILIIFALIFICTFISSYKKINDYLYNDVEIDESVIFNTSDYNLDNDYDRSNYLSDKAYYELQADGAKLKSSYKASLLLEKGYESKYCIGEAELNKDTESYNNCLADYNAIYDNIKNHDYLYFYNQDKEQLEIEIKDLEASYNASNSKKEKENIQIEIDDNKIQLEILNIKINDKLDPDNKNSYGMILTLNNYVNSYSSYSSSKKDRKLYKKQSDYESYLMTERDYFVSKYKVDNKIKTSSEYKDTISESSIVSDASYASVLIIVLIVVLGGGIVADEFNKGTIKQLLVRPYSRSKILLSKIIAIFIVLIAFMAIQFGLNILMYGFNYGFDFITHNYLVYNFSNNKVSEVNVILYSLLRMIGVLPQYIIVLLSAVALSILTLKSNVANALGFLVGFSKTIADVFTYGYTIKFYEYVPYNCWNLGEFMFGNLPSLMNSTLLKSVIVCLIVIILLLFIEFKVFKNKDIKNQ